MSFTVTVSEPFVARHALTVPDAGPEGRLHTHRYVVEATFRGPTLDEGGYLIDIVEASAALGSLVERFRDERLNDHLEGNPSCERLARAFHRGLCEAIAAPGVEELEVAIHEDDEAVVTFVGPL